MAAINAEGYFYYLWWGHAGFPEGVRRCKCPGCSTCSSVLANSLICAWANSAPGSDNLGKTGPSQPRWACRPAHPVSCPLAAFEKVKLNWKGAKRDATKNLYLMSCVNSIGTKQILTCGSSNPKLMLFGPADATFSKTIPLSKEIKAEELENSVPSDQSPFPFATG